MIKSIDFRCALVLVIGISYLVGCDTSRRWDDGVAVVPEPLSGPEIKVLLEGNSVQGMTSGAVPLTVYFPEYGEMRGVHSFNYKDKGTWRVTGDAFCGQWANWWGTQERCWQILIQGQLMSWVRPDGTGADEVEVVDGNPGGL